jgi:hypothetical protein
MHGFCRDGKAGFGRMFPLQWRNMDSPIVASAGIGKGEEFLPVAGLEEDGFSSRCGHASNSGGGCGV